MTTKPRAITPATLGSWVVKCSRDHSPVDQLISTEFSSVTSWCLRRTYRADLVRSGQPVLLWLSGDDSVRPAGIYAQGLTTGAAAPMESDDAWVDPADRAGRTIVMPVRLQLVNTPILRSELLAHPVLRQIEVLRMAAGSNPSFLTRDQLAELQAAWPQLAVDT